MTPFVFESRSPAETRRAGRALGNVAEPGLVAALFGTLGAGKTAFVRAVAEGLETPDPRMVTSPTFVLVHEYEGRLPIYHFDVYRLPTVEAFVDLGADEYFTAGGVCLIEWADKVASALPADRLEIGLEVVGPTERRFTVRASGAASGPAMRALDRWIQALDISATRPEAPPSADNPVC